MQRRMHRHLRLVREVASRGRRCRLPLPAASRRCRGHLPQPLDPVTDLWPLVPFPLCKLPRGASLRRHRAAQGPRLVEQATRRVEDGRPGG